MPIRSSDVVVIGGGVNGLSCAIRLARAGAKVTLVEAADALGGAAKTVEFHPGFRVSQLAHLAPAPDPRLAAAAGLPAAAEDLPTTVLGGGPPLTVRGRVTTGPDAAAWAALHDRLSRFAAVLAPLRQMAPPRLAAGSGNPLLALARRGLAARALGAEEFRELLRMILTNLADVADDHLTDDRLKALLAFDGTLGGWLGPQSPNSLILYLDRLAQGTRSLPAGGTGALVAALARAAERAGVTLRTGSRVAGIEPDGSGVAAVVLADGTRLPGRIVASTLAPQATLRGLLPAAEIDTGLRRRVRAIRSRGAAAKLNLALTALPRFAAPGDRMVLAASARAVEAAWNPVKYGEVPQRPVIEAVIPSLADASLSPDGHVLSAVIQFAPCTPRDPEAARAALLENALAVLEQAAPGLRRLIVHAQLLMPQDIERLTGAPGGAWHHADLAVEQMFVLRPLPELAQYRTPVPGLWLAGAGAHPGGGLSGTAGWNAAEAIVAGERA